MSFRLSYAGSSEPGSTSNRATDARLRWGRLPRGGVRLWAGRSGLAEAGSRLSRLLHPFVFVSLSVVFPLSSGCPLPVQQTGDIEPDMKVVVTVVEDVYGQLERPGSVFLSAESVDDSTMARVRSSLRGDLTVAFHPPSERISGDPGASIALGRFHQVDEDERTVVASFVNDDGVGKGCTEYTLHCEGDDWIIAETADAWSTCPMNTYQEESYHVAVARARGDECFGLWANIGTCGGWLFVTETNGYTGTSTYYDPQTGLEVAAESFTDVAEESEYMDTVDCEQNVVETILCYR